MAKPAASIFPALLFAGRTFLIGAGRDPSCAGRAGSLPSRGRGSAGETLRRPGLWSTSAARISMGDMRMSDGETFKFLIIPYRLVDGALATGRMQQSSSLEAAERIAASLAERFSGVALYKVSYDRETGAMTSPDLLWSEGPVPDASMHKDWFHTL
jgi:hypothetical protein